MRAMLEDRWSTPEASVLTGCTDRQLQHWCVRGYVAPENNGIGNGGEHRWSIDDLVRVMVLRGVLDNSKSHSAGQSRALERLVTVPLEGDLLVIEPYVAARTAEQVAELTAMHPLVTVVPLASIRNKLQTRIDALRYQATG